MKSRFQFVVFKSVTLGLVCKTTSAIFHQTGDITGISIKDYSISPWDFSWIENYKLYASYKKMNTLPIVRTVIKID